ncbi:cell division cycle protein 123-like protein [Mycena kentingensis (nom. inval.)]|nr:cell division cycle protein 123-like protein [Mycena kentingensis (nom. inval.)]
MSLLESIRAGKHLKKVGIVHDASAPSLVDTLTISAQYDAAILSANIEHWAAPLEALGLTAPTRFVPLSTHHARLLLRAYEVLEGADSAEKVAAAAAHYAATGEVGAPLCAEEGELRAVLGDSVQRAIDALGSPDSSDTVAGGCFVKLSSRSPKDAAARSGVFERHYAAALRTVRAAAEDLDDVKRMWIVCEAEGAALRFKITDEVVRALVLSERVWQDMTLALRHPHSWTQNIILRTWQPVPIDLEFRTFVAGGRITAISQYAYQLCSPRLVVQEEKEKAVRAIQHAFAQLWPVLSGKGWERCVLDFGVIPQDGDAEWRATLIELNPFEETTDSALFSWTRERAIIEGRCTDTSCSVEYPVVRVTETKRVAALSMIPRGWKDVMQRVEADTEL